MNDNETVDQENKTFTQEELDQVVADRVARERRKFSDYNDLKTKAQKFDEIEENNKSEMEKLTDKNKKLQSQLDSLNAKNSLREAQDKVAAETGLPISVVKNLSGSTVEDLTKSAQSVLDFGKNSGYPQVKNSSEHKQKSFTKKEQFGEWLNENLN